MFSAIRWLLGGSSSPAVSPKSPPSVASPSTSFDLHDDPATHSDSHSDFDSEGDGELVDDVLDPWNDLRVNLHQICSLSSTFKRLDLDAPWEIISTCLNRLMESPDALDTELSRDLNLTIQYLCTAAKRTTYDEPPAKELYERLDYYMRGRIRHTRLYVQEMGYSSYSLVRFYVKKWRLFLASARKVSLLFTCVHEEFVRLDRRRAGNLVGVYPYLLGLWKDEFFGRDHILSSIDDAINMDLEDMDFRTLAEHYYTVEEANESLAVLGIATPIRREKRLPEEKRMTKAEKKERKKAERKALRAEQKQLVLHR